MQRVALVGRTKCLGFIIIQWLDILQQHQQLNSTIIPLATTQLAVEDLFLRQLASIWLSNFVNSGLSFVLAQMNATGCISGQNKMIVFYSGSESSMPWEGVVA